MFIEHVLTLKMIVNVGVKVLMFFLSQVRASTVRIQEGGVRLELTVVDTPGFGDVVDNSNW